LGLAGIVEMTVTIHAPRLDKVKAGALGAGADAGPRTRASGSNKGTKLGSGVEESLRQFVGCRGSDGTDTRAST